MNSSADVIANALYLSGVRHAFGIPGGEVLALVDALERAGIRFVITRHENAAGFMAEGAYRATGAPGVLVSTVGPGVANGINSIVNAQQERVPLIVFTGKVAEAETLSYSHQIFDHQDALRPFVKASFEARENACDILIDKALHIAMSARRGPVHIDLPIPVAKATHGQHCGKRPALAAPVTPAPSSQANYAQALFAQSERPLIIVGQDILDETEDSINALTTFAQTHSIPVLSTYKAKGVFPENDPLSIGGHGLSPKSDSIVLPLVANADCIICAGYDPIEMRAGWRDAFASDRAIVFASAINDHFMHREEYFFQASTGSGLSLFTDLSPSASWANGEPLIAREALNKAFSRSESWGASTLFTVLSHWLQNGMTVTVDSGAHRILLSQIIQCTRPRQLLQSTGLCTMGCALPMASGYALSKPNTPVLSVMGDGCLDMVLGELATLRDQNLPVTILVVVDASYSLIALKQQAEGYASVGVDFGTSDYAGIASALGIASWTADSVESLNAALDASHSQNRPGIIVVPLPRLAYKNLI